MCNCESKSPEVIDLSKLDNILDGYRDKADMLIQVLLKIQKEYNWLPKEALYKVSQTLNVPVNRVYHVATFYKLFSVIPKGKHNVSVCVGTACHVFGAPKILDRLEKPLGIKAGETTSDLKFSLETVNCLGCCALGPVVVVDGHYHGKLPTADAEKILADYD